MIGDSGPDASELQDGAVVGTVMERWTEYEPETWLIDHEGSLWTCAALVVVDRTCCIMIDQEAFDRFLERWA